MNGRFSAKLNALSSTCPPQSAEFSTRCTYASKVDASSVYSIKGAKSSSCCRKLDAHTWPVCIFRNV